MRNRLGFAAIGIALLAPMAFANGGEGGDKKKGLALLGEQVNVTAEMGKGITFDAGDTFSLNLKAAINFQWRYSAIDFGDTANTLPNRNPDTHSIDARSTRLIMSGHVFDTDTRFKFSIDAADASPAIKDAWFERKLYGQDDWSLKVRAGQQKPLFSREYTGSLYYRAFTEHSLAARSFSGVRARGANFIWSGLENKFHINAGLFNTSAHAGSRAAAEDGTNADSELDFTVGVRYGINGDMGAIDYSAADLGRSESWNLAFGGGLWFGNAEVFPAPGGAVGSKADVENVAWNVNAVFKSDGFSGLVDVFGNSSELTGTPDVDSTGLTAQALYTLENDWTFGLRYSLVSLDDNDPFGIGISPNQVGGSPLPGSAPGINNNLKGETSEFSLMAGKFWNGYSNMIVGEITFQSVEPNVVNANNQDADNIIFRVTYQLIF